MKIVLDTNVLISALIKAGPPRDLFTRITGGKVTLILSRNLVKEFMEVSKDPKISRYVGDKEVHAFLRVLNECATIVKIRSRFRVIDEDPDDDVVLRTAHNGKADFIVSGDKHLLSLGNFKGITIVPIKKMLQLLPE